MSRWTLRKKHQSLKQLLQAMEHFGAPPGIARQVKPVGELDPRTVIATQEELCRLLTHADPWMQLHIYLLSHCGLRFRSAAIAAPRHYDPESQTLTLPVKGHHVHRIPVSEPVRMYIEAALPRATHPDEPFRVMLGGPANPRSIHPAWTRLKARARVNPELRMHDIRRTTAVGIYEATKDVRAVQQVLGHRRLGSTFHYLAPYDPERIRPILEAMWTPVSTDKVQ